MVKLESLKQRNHDFENDSDRDIFVKDELILKLSEIDGLKKSSFDFVIRTKG